MAKKTVFQLLLSLSALIISYLAFHNSWGSWSGQIIVSLINLYILFLLIVAAAKSDSKNWFDDNIYKVMPTRVFSILLFLIFVATIIYSFANIYLIEGVHFKEKITKPDNAYYTSFQVLTSLSEGSNSPESPFLQRAIMFEIISAINLLIGGFGLVISRIANFGKQAGN